MKCRLCFFSGSIARSGGTERVGSIIANSLCNQGYDVYLLSYWNQGKPYYTLNSMIKLFYLLDSRIEEILNRTKIFSIIKLHKFLKKNKIDILIDIDTVLSWHSARAIKGTQCKLISWEHFNYWAMLKLNEKKRFVAKDLIKKHASKLVVLTEEDRKKHIEEYNLSQDFVVTMPNPCLSDINEKYDFDHKIFLAVGRLVCEKNFSALLNAWSRIQDECSGWKVIIVGKGKLEETLKSQSAELRLKNLIFAGQTNQIEEYYKKASCLVLSSDYEGFPMVILEAQSYGLPVISFDCKTGPRDLVFDNVNGYLVEAGNVEQLAERMFQFTQNKDNAIKMSVQSSKNVRKYNLDNITEKWIKLIDDVYTKR